MLESTKSTVFVVLASIFGGYVVSVGLWHNWEWSYPLTMLAGQLKASMHEISKVRPTDQIPPYHSGTLFDAILYVLRTPFTWEIVGGAVIFFLCVLLPFFIVTS